MKTSKKFKDLGLAYFSADGNFGSIDEDTPLIVVPISEWTDELHGLIEEVSDFDRISLAGRIFTLLRSGKTAQVIWEIITAEIADGKYE